MVKGFIEELLLLAIIGEVDQTFGYKESQLRLNLIFDYQLRDQFAQDFGISCIFRVVLLQDGCGGDAQLLQHGFQDALRKLVVFRSRRNLECIFGSNDGFMSIMLDIDGS